jgi:hypothetical protein
MSVECTLRYLGLHNVGFQQLGAVLAERGFRIPQVKAALKAAADATAKLGAALEIASKEGVTVTVR